MQAHLLLLLAAGSASIFWAAADGSALAQTAEKRLEGQGGKERMEAVRLEVANVRSNVFLTLVELDRVRGERGPDRPRFRAFTAQLATMQDIAKAFAARAEEMKRKGAAYFQDWEAQGKQSDPRYAERKEAYEAINRFMQDARGSFVDFVAILREIKSLLEVEPNPASIAKAKDLFGKANWRCIDVQRALANMELQLDRLGESFAKDEPRSP
jgi:hypothetical protein